MVLDFSLIKGLQPVRLSVQRLAVILCDTHQIEAAAERIGRRLSQAADCPISSGYARFPNDGKTVAELIETAIQHRQSREPP